MTKAKHLGIWRDHASAHLMEFTVDPIETKTIETNASHHSHNFGKNENLIHHKEQHQAIEYYKKLGQIVKDYEEVIFFGPTDAKVELFNFLRKDQHFAKVKMTVKQADKMTENQQHAFVREYFSKSHIF